MSTKPHFTLNNGVPMPALGFGVLFSSGDETVGMVRTAIETGYRLLDTAAAYRNEEQVGEGIRQSGIDRSDLFVTTKLALPDYGHDQTLRAFDASLARLGLDYLDLYLLHWPVPRAFDDTRASWRALEKLYADGRVRAVGVCNFNPGHLANLIEQSDVVPANGGVKRYWAKDPATAHDPLHDPVIAAIGTRHGKTAAQVILRWHLQHGNSAIPKSSRQDRIAGNMAIFDFDLPQQDMETIDGLDCNERGGPDPEVNDLAAIRKRTGA